MSGLVLFPFFFFMLYENWHKYREQRPQWDPTLKWFDKFKWSYFMNLEVTSSLNQSCNWWLPIWFKTTKTSSSLNKAALWISAEWGHVPCWAITELSTLAHDGSRSRLVTTHSQCKSFLMCTRRDLSSIWIISPKMALCWQGLSFLAYGESLSENEPKT